MPKKVFPVRFDIDVLDEIERRVGPKGRGDFIRDAVTKALGTLSVEASSGGLQDPMAASGPRDAEVERMVAKGEPAVEINRIPDGRAAVVGNVLLTHLRKKGAVHRNRAMADLGLSEREFVKLESPLLRNRQISSVDGFLGVEGGA